MVILFFFYLRDVGELEGTNTVCTNRQVLWENGKITRYVNKKA